MRSVLTALIASLLIATAAMAQDGGSKILILPLILLTFYRVSQDLRNSSV